VSLFLKDVTQVSKKEKKEEEREIKVKKRREKYMRLI